MLRQITYAPRLPGVFRRTCSAGISQYRSNGAGAANFPLIEHMNFAMPANRLYGRGVDQVLIAFKARRIHRERRAQ